MKKLVRFSFGLLLLVSFACSSDSSGDPVDDTPTTTDDNGGQTGTTGDPRQDFPENFQATGSSGADIVSNADFDRLVVQIAHVTGFRPTQAAMDAFEEYLRELTFKEDITINFLELGSPDEETLTLSEISEFEIDNRTSYNDGRTLAIYIYFADSPSDDDEEDEGLVTLGAVYRNTSMVIFESTIRSLANRSALITLADLETATLNHEFGHLFGLVNLGTPTINDHEETTTDENNEVIGNNHCNVDGCLMRAELQFTAAKSFAANRIQNLHNPSCQVSASQFIKTLESRVSKGLVAPPIIDTECRLDIEAIGARITSNSAKGY
ncbi:hypothetical protein [Croceivirga thetidis]|uniref:Membrane metalloprotease n=1 Tax=Croceivirga thetidis TaxID=2721623 RepID=A0ABX1GU52_9FLAO|nr:hypothetical protein [Croceivirga thetidis]NKI33169.1 hypothetical protein [Croceivirga thetidis]